MSLNPIRPWRNIERRQSRKIMVGSVPVGGDAPISVQTMTNTLTSDAKATIDQIRRCEDAGADLIRVSCPDAESTAALGKIVKAARVPLIADIHFHYKRALEAAMVLTLPASLALIMQWFTAWSFVTWEASDLSVYRQAGEVIAPLALAVTTRMKVSAFAGVVLPYPTLAEIGKRAAGAYFSPRLFGSAWIKTLVRVVQRLLA